MSTIADSPPSARRGLRSTASRAGAAPGAGATDGPATSPDAAARANGSRREPAHMGYQPGLDGLRAVSVIAVMLYHLHALDRGRFLWFKGGFFGVEVFFVVSGFLITSLLIEEHRRTGGVALGQFWLRRARRLLPALYTMLAVVGIWAALWRPDTVARLRTDFPGALLYYSNWLQIFDQVGYFAALDTPPLLRHLWSLAVEEQWYLIWPPTFLVLMRWTGGRARRLLLPLVGAALVSSLLMPVLFVEGDVDRANFLYLGTLTRASGLLIGAALATRWSPWRWSGAGRRHLVALDVVGFVAIAVLSAAVIGLGNESASVYRGGFQVVSVMSAVAIAAVTHPGARLMQRTFGWRPLVAIGKRSYGLYLWHWPVFVLVRATTGIERLVLSVAVTIVLSEACYRFVEEPVRRGALGRWFAARREARGDTRRKMTTATVLYGMAAAALAFPLAWRVASAHERNIALDTANDVAFELTGDAAAAASATSAAAAGEVDDATTATTDAVIPTSDVPAAAPTVAPSTTLPVLPRSVTIVGDSQAHSLAINLPTGIESTFTINDGSVEGCGVWDEGSVITERTGFTRSFDGCAGWAGKWADAAAGSDVTLVVLGAWDVFDVDTDSGVVAFGTPAGDSAFLGKLQQGIDAVTAAGSKVALLEVACMRPVASAGAGVPPLPERADDQRVAHLNELLRQAAADDPDDVVFVEGPSAWCDDPAISTDLNYRWDGVHVYKPGANLIYETIAPALLQIPI